MPFFHYLLSFIECLNKNSHARNVSRIRKIKETDNAFKKYYFRYNMDCILHMTSSKKSRKTSFRTPPTECMYIIFFIFNLRVTNNKFLKKLNHFADSHPHNK